MPLFKTTKAALTKIFQSKPANPPTPSPPHTIARTGFHTIPSNIDLEEESRSPAAHGFYPAVIGEIIGDQFQIVCKLGYGGSSTVWLCRDLKNHAYITAKISRHRDPRGYRELAFYADLATHSSSKHIGLTLLRSMNEAFNIRHSTGDYLCLTHTPLYISLDELRKLRKDAGYTLPEDLVKQVVRCICTVMDFMHRECGYVHTDLNEGNILFTIPHTPGAQPSILETLEHLEQTQPSPRKYLGTRIVYKSRSLPVPYPESQSHAHVYNPSTSSSTSTTERITFGHPLVTDFSEARKLPPSSPRYLTGKIQPAEYRAPEVLLNLPWSTSVDVWNLGCLVFDILFNNTLFPRPPEALARRDPKPGMTIAVSLHLARVVGVLGRPPREMVVGGCGRGGGGGNAEYWFTADGGWKGRDGVVVREKRLGDYVKRGVLGGGAGGVEEEEATRQFMEFVNGCLQWRGGDRRTMGELLRGPWVSPDGLEEVEGFLG